MRFLLPLAICAAILMTSLSVPGVSSVSALDAETGSCQGTVTSLADPLTAGVWKSINDVRVEAGETALVWSESLARATAYMAQDANTRDDVTSDVDSLGRDPRARATDCGYRPDAQVAESLNRDGLYIDNPFNVWTIWRPGDVSRMYAILYSPVLYPPPSGYVVGALGRYRNSDGVDYWVLNAGTLPEGIAPLPTRVTSTPTVARATSTPTAIPTTTATSTAIPTATSLPTATPSLYVHERACERVSGDDLSWVERCTD